MQDINTLMESRKLYRGRFLSGGKKSPLGCKCVFNANLISPTQRKVWYGDLNLTKEGKKLKLVAAAAGETLYVLEERDCRFDNEKDPVEVLLTRAVWNTDLPIP